MKLIRPITVVSADLTSNVLETPPSAYNAGTTYAAGDQVSVFSGPSSTLATMYESLVGSNTGNTPSSSPTFWQPIGTAYLTYNGGTSYAIGAVVSDTTNHLLYESLQGSNSGHALTDTAWWLELGPSNKWAMFDQKNGTQTVRPLEIVTTVSITGTADTVALLNIEGAAANITVMDGMTEAFNEDYSLISSEGIIDWYEYYFEPVVRKTDLLVTGLPNIGDPDITITLTDDDDVSIGNCVIGLSREIGDTEYGASVGIKDFSRKEEDDFGDYYIVERAFSKKGRFIVWIDAVNTDYVFTLLSGYRATPIVIIGADAYASTYLFGLLKDWNIDITYPSHSVMTIEVEGL